MKPSDLIESIVKVPRGYGGVRDVEFRKSIVDFLSKYGEPEVDEIGNIWFVNKEVTKTLFVAHTDSVDHPKTAIDKPITVDKHGIMSLNTKKVSGIKGQSPYCLGADDGAGIAMNLCLIDAGVKGTYLFTVGEEKGCVGAKWIVENSPQRLDPFLLCIEVDRAGTDEIITEQSTGKCASDAFAKSLASAIGMNHEPSPHGVYTDNAHFHEHINECVNIAAGYERQHSLNETQDLHYLDELFHKLAKVDFDKLTVERDCTDIEPDMSGYGGYFGNGWGYSNYGMIYDGWDCTYRKLTKDEMDACELIEENPVQILEMLYANGFSLEDIL